MTSPNVARIRTSINLHFDFEMNSELFYIPVSCLNEEDVRKDLHKFLEYKEFIPIYDKKSIAVKSYYKAHNNVDNLHLVEIRPREVSFIEALGLHLCKGSDINIENVFEVIS